jgi:hypothetical protein
MRSAGITVELFNKLGSYTLNIKLTLEDNLYIKPCDHWLWHVYIQPSSTETCLKLSEKTFYHPCITQKLSRKLVHTTSGPLFVLTWPLFRYIWYLRFKYLLAHEAADSEISSSTCRGSWANVSELACLGFKFDHYALWWLKMISPPM